MKFQKDTIYHIYNQGNNRQIVFFKPDNYLFFLRKMREFILPYGDFLCYCLMPNHFHWLFYVRETELMLYDSDTEVAHNSTIPAKPDKLRSLNDAIGILLRSYTRAINKQEDRSGALFREKTKASDGWKESYLPISHPNHQKALQKWEDYGLMAFNYIHENPVKAYLVTAAEEWPYSSAMDFAGKRNGTLCNQALAKRLLFLR